jgi:hypothetical protein
MEGSGRCLIKVYPGMYLEGQRKTTKTLRIAEMWTRDLPYMK